ncbi:MAG: cyclodeaminase/cyclohydrolase family protein [Elusimicrobium sp.]|jgi:glutamate formiminotransferase/formiminotetrahydrofolate cyclodeaminase|nr:cyclodeaminase/cyclohydrolase family protein [Elusimicrobium sp.]
MEKFDWSEGIENYIDALSSGSAVPGGGSAAAAAAAFGCGLALMAIATTLKLKSTNPAFITPLASAENGLKTSLGKFKNFVTQDSVVYQKYLETKKAAKADPSISINPALKEIAVVPIDCALECMVVLKETGKIKSGVAPMIISDMNCAEHLLLAALKCCVENMKINLPYVKEAAVEEMLKQTIEQALKTAEARP